MGDWATMASEYASFKGIYNGDSSSGMTTFVEMLCGIVSIGIVYMLCSQTTWIDSLAETFGIGWGWIAFGGGVVYSNRRVYGII